MARQKSQLAPSSRDELVRELRRSRRRINIFRDIAVADQAFVLEVAPPALQRKIFSGLHNDEIIALLNPLDPDRATQLIRQLPQKRGTRITNELSAQLKEKVEFLLRFHPQTAAGMMNTDYLIATPDMKFGELAGIIEKHEAKTGRFPTTLCVSGKKLIGELPGHILALKPASTRVGDNCRKIASMQYNADERSVVSKFVSHPHDKVVVLDDDKSILGIVHSDDVLSLLDRRALHDLFNFAGVSHEEDALDSAWSKFKSRYLWLIINLATAFLAASVVGSFEDTISKFTLLAVYMPIVAGMGGNAATQTLAVAVRGLVMKEIDLKTGWGFAGKEVLASLYNGIVNGAIVGLAATLFNKNPLLGLVLAIAMIANLLIAGFFGAVIPLIMKALGKDPATSATIFITTCTDVGGFFVFLSLAKLILVQG
jgi:magnesium transporter